MRKTNNFIFDETQIPKSKYQKAEPKKKDVKKKNKKLNNQTSKDNKKREKIEEGFEAKNRGS